MLKKIAYSVFAYLHKKLIFQRLVYFYFHSSPFILISFIFD
ncbi:Hypothetical protein ABZS17G119_02380 [Kosakonia cowanii]